MPTDDETEVLDAEDDEDDGPDPAPARLSLQQAAKFLGVSTHTVRRMVRDGQLQSLTPKGKKAYFSLEDVQGVAGLKQERDRLDLPPKAAEELARANAITDMVASANSHSEEFYKLGLQTMRAALLSMKEQLQLVMQSHKALDASREREIDRVIAEVDKYRAERTEYLAKLDEFRVKEQDDADRAQKRAFLWDTVKEVKSLAKSIIATKMRDPANKSAVGVSSLKDLFDTLTDEQMATLMMGGKWEGLKPEQLAMLQALLASQATDEEKAEAKAEAGAST